jgi:acetyltransferase-like isoleucine patch superfamily enzyme
MSMGSMNSPTIIENRIVDVSCGPDVRIVKPVNLYGCHLGAGTFVGPFTEIQKNVEIGRNCRIQSHTFICELVKIGDDCFIGHGVVFINDLFEEGGPARGDRSRYKSTRIGTRVSIGSNATILPVTIADGTVIGAGAVVTRDIVAPGVYAGNPARPLRLFPE